MSTITGAADVSPSQSAFVRQMSANSQAPGERKINFHSKILYPSVAVLALAACGGSSTSSESLISDPVDIVTSAVEATVGRDSLNSAASFPMRYTLNEPGGSQATIQSGVGLVEVIDEDTIQITLEQGDTPVQLTSTIAGGDDFTGLINGETVSISLAKGSDTILAFLDADADASGFGLTGIYGFETPADRIPLLGAGSVVYDRSGLASAYIATSGDTEILVVNQPGSTNPSLTINFDNGDVFGTLFDGTAMVDLEDDGSMNDTLNLTVTMDGNISSGDITGDVSLAANVDLGSNPGNVDLSPTVSDSFVDATLYGYDANVVGGNFQATSQFDDNGETIDAVVGGTFFTAN